MGRPTKEPLRSLTAAETVALEQLARSRNAPASQVARAGALLAVARGATFTAAAQQVGRRSGDAVAHLVARFNREGLPALEPRHGGGPSPTYGPAERERILAEFHRPPDRQRDGTATWSLTTLQRALRTAADGLPQVSTYTLWGVLHEADLRWQRDRSWCHTGRSVRRRQRSGRVEETVVYDPDARAKKG
jgi:transposase